MMSEPTRLLDDPAIAEGLRADLVQAQSVVLQGLDVSAGAASLSAAIAAEATAAGTAGAGASKMLALGLAGAVTAGALVWFALSDSDPKQAAAPVVESTDGVEAAPLPSPASKPIAKPIAKPTAKPTARPLESEAVAGPGDTEPELIGAPSLVEPVAASPEVVPAVRRRPRKAEKQADYLREAKLISDARTAMKSDASGALELLAQARSEFPRGLLREEREALTILSLAELGRSTQARASAKRFLEKHEKSPYAAVVRQVLD